MKRYLVLNLLKIGNVHVQHVEYKEHSEFNNRDVHRTILISLLLSRKTTYLTFHVREV